MSECSIILQFRSKDMKRFDDVGHARAVIRDEFGGKFFFDLMRDERGSVALLSINAASRVFNALKDLVAVVPARLAVAKVMRDEDFYDPRNEMMIEIPITKEQRLQIETHINQQMGRKLSQVHYEISYQGLGIKAPNCIGLFIDAMNKAGIQLHDILPTGTLSDKGIIPNTLTAAGKRWIKKHPDSEQQTVNLIDQDKNISWICHSADGIGVSVRQA